MNHKVIEGNLLSKNLYIDIEKELKGQKVDFIVERMLAGKKLLPQDINTLMRTLKFWYKILDEEGVMFVESPKEFKPLLAEWDSMITNKYSEVIDFSSKYNLFRLQKLKGAPEELPALDLENINHTEN